ncbi:MAG: mechanosensitive ion channel family protein [Lachnospira sp.]
MNYFNYLFALSGTQGLEETTEQVTAFFSKSNLSAILNTLCNWGLSIIGKIVIALVIWAIGKRIIKFGTKFVSRILEKSTLDTGIVHFAISVMRFVMYAVLIMIVVDELGFQTASIITLFGSAALAVGMSLQGSLSNFAGGVLILIFKPFRVGDYIVVGSLEGTVNSIELLYTKLITVDNKVVVLPNGSLANSNVVNVGAEPVRRLDIEVSVGYSSDIKKAKDILLETINNNSYILKDRDIKVIVKELAESCVTIETRTWVATSNYWDARFELLERYKEEFDKNGIEIPFNQLDVHVKN